MNRVELIGNFTRDPEMGETGSGMAYAHFTVAVNRDFRSKDGEKKTDFINCTAWGKTAELVGKYLHKGSKAGIVGRIETSSYKGDDGKTKYSTSVTVDTIEFLTSKSAEGDRFPDDYTDAPFDDSDDDIPF